MGGGAHWCYGGLSPPGDSEAVPPKAHSQRFTEPSSVLMTYREQLLRNHRVGVGHPAGAGLVAIIFFKDVFIIYTVFWLQARRGH